jgi:hypothetical protein
MTCARNHAHTVAECVRRVVTPRETNLGQHAESLFFEGVLVLGLDLVVDDVLEYLNDQVEVQVGPLHQIAVVIVGLTVGYELPQSVHHLAVEDHFSLIMRRPIPDVLGDMFDELQVFQVGVEATRRVFLLWIHRQLLDRPLVVYNEESKKLVDLFDKYEVAGLARGTERIVAHFAIARFDLIYGRNLISLELFVTAVDQLDLAVFHHHQRVIHRGSRDEPNIILGFDYITHCVCLKRIWSFSWPRKLLSLRDRLDLSVQLPVLWKGALPLAKYTVLLSMCYRREQLLCAILHDHLVP